MKTFKLENGEEVDVIKHTQEILAEHSDVKIYVGCDSQNKRKGCIYALVIAYRFIYGDSGTRKGARYIYSDEWVPKTKDKFTRLRGEYLKSVELALWLQEQGFKIHKIDLDFNHKQTTGSHNMVAEGQGYCAAYGFDSTCKPDEQIASRAGDHIVKKKSGGERRKKYSRVRNRNKVL